MINLAELKGEELLDVTCDLIEPLSAIMTDKELMGAFDTKSDFDGLTEEERAEQLTALGVKRIVTLVPLILKKNRAETLEIVSILTGETVEELKNMNGLKLVKTTIEVFKINFISLKAIFLELV